MTTVAINPSIVPPTEGTTNIVSSPLSATASLPISQLMAATGSNPAATWPINFLSSPITCIRTLPNGSVILQPQLATISAGGLAPTQIPTILNPSQLVGLTHVNGGRATVVPQIMSPLSLAQVPVSASAIAPSLPVISVQVPKTVTSS